MQARRGPFLIWIEGEDPPFASVRIARDWADVVEARLKADQATDGNWSWGCVSVREATAALSALTQLVEAIDAREALSSEQYGDGPALTAARAAIAPRKGGE